MSQMHGKKLFTGLVHVKGFFVLDVAPVHEIEHPFRSCRYALFVHFWPGYALVLGWWKKRWGEKEVLMMAIRGREISVEETDAGFRNTGRKVLEGSQEDS